MFEDRGEVNSDHADDANIPVNIFIERSDGRWRLVADNFMPRTERVGQLAYELVADNRDEFKPFLERVRALYAIALARIDAMLDGSGSNLYYWSEKIVI